MIKINENDLSSLLLENFNLTLVEPNIYSVLQDSGSGNEYDTPFGSIYEWIACNPLYNRLVWGYSVKIFFEMAHEAVRSDTDGRILDLGCGSLAFTADTYSRYSGRPVILVDQSIKMLKSAKSRLIKRNGKVPANLILLHSDALEIPFQKKTFKTILSQNLLHCLKDTGILLKQLNELVSKESRMYFTTLIKNNRVADKYLEALADKGKLVSRTVHDHKRTFDRFAMPVTYQTKGNILSICCKT